MADQQATTDRWTFYSASQNLPAVLNDPNKGKQSNFFTRTWGDAFTDAVDTGKSPFLPDISHAHFDVYLRKYARRHRRHARLSTLRIEEGFRRKSESISNEENGIGSIPALFFDPNLTLHDPVVFNTVFGKSQQNGHVLQEQLSHYLDCVEDHIAKQVSQKSGAFFHTMTSHDTLMEQMGRACGEVRHLRAKIQAVDKMLACDSLRLAGFARSRTNQVVLLDKLKLMATVLQTQPTLQILLSASDYVAALELIERTQEVLAKELAGVTSLRHLPSQLKEMCGLIDKMLSTEFERYAASDLHRPLEEDGGGVLEPERLTSLVAGLLRQNHLQFLETYKLEAVTAAQAVLKQLVIVQLADVEDDKEHCVTGSGESAPKLDAVQWLRVISLGSSALKKLLQRVYDVHSVIKATADATAALGNGISENCPDAERFLCQDDHKRVEKKLQELLVSVCDYCLDRLASLINNQSERQAVATSEITQLSEIVEGFTEDCRRVCGRQRPTLTAAFNIQARNFVNKFHSQRKSKLTCLLDTERWKPVEVPPEFQLIINKLASGEPLSSLPSSPVEDVGLNSDSKKASDVLYVGSQSFVTVGTVLMLVQLVSEYCVCAHDLPAMAPVIGRNLTELLRTFNSRSCQLVLGAGLLKLAELNTITSTNLALTSRALQLVLWMIPPIRAHFTSISEEALSGLDAVERDVCNHVQQLESKILSIMNTLVGEQLQEWDAKPPVPSKTFRSISRQLTKLHEAVSCVLPAEQVCDIYEVIHKNFKSKLREVLIRTNIQNNGGPQHGVVTSEILFYLETIRRLKVLPDKHISDKAMDDIWTR